MQSEDVAYRGGPPAFTDLLGGQVQLYFPVVPAAIEYIRARKLRALAVTSPTRLESLPDTPTVAEFLPGYEASNGYGLGAPKNTPAEIVEKLNKVPIQIWEEKHVQGMVWNRQ